MTHPLALMLLALGLAATAEAAAGGTTTTTTTTSTTGSPTSHLLGDNNGVVDDWDQQEDTLLDQAIKLLEAAEVAPTIKDLQEAIKDLSIAEDMEEQEVHPREAKEPKGPRVAAGPRKPTSARPRKVKEDHEEIIKQEKNAIQLVQDAVGALQTNNRAKTAENIAAALDAVKKADRLNEDEDLGEGDEKLKAASKANGAAAASAPTPPKRKK